MSVWVCGVWTGQVPLVWEQGQQAKVTRLHVLCEMLVSKTGAA
jgi:hypothetical protein